MSASPPTMANVSLLPGSLTTSELQEGSAPAILILFANSTTTRVAAGSSALIASI